MAIILTTYKVMVVHDEATIPVSYMYSLTLQDLAEGHHDATLHAVIRCESAIAVPVPRLPETFAQMGVPPGMFLGAVSGDSLPCAVPEQRHRFQLTQSVREAMERNGQANADLSGETWVLIMDTSGVARLEKDSGTLDPSLLLARFTPRHGVKTP